MSEVRTGCILLLLVFSPAVRNAPGQDRPVAKQAPARALISVKGEIEHPLEFSAEQFGKCPRQSVEAKDHDGKDAVYEGVPLVELLKSAGLKFGQELRGKELANYLVVEASDGYRAVFALPELDPAFTDRVVLIADRRDKHPLD